MSTFVHFTPEQLNLSSGIPLGAGAISHVLRTTLPPPFSLPVAVKIYSKLQLLQLRKVEGALNEKKALLQLRSHPYVARLYGTAQSEDELYAVMELLPNGDLLQHIRRAKASFPPRPGGSCARGLDFHDLRLITAQLVLGLAHVFATGLVVRDLKPENVVFDGKARACLVDFDTVDLAGGLARPRPNHGVALPPRRAGGASAGAGNEGPREAGARPPRRSIKVSEILSMRRSVASFCGTAQYVSPEMVAECRWSFSSDLWALGTIVYEMLYGVHMFAGATSFEVMQKVIKGVAGDGGRLAAVPFPIIDFEEGGAGAGPKGESVPSDAFARVKSFILGLVNIDPCQRLGVNPETHEFDLEALRGHAFFCGFDWSVVDNQIQTFRQPTFPMGNTAEDANTTAPLAVLDSDPSPSLQSFYHAVPYNDQRYVDYVYNSSSEENPFERYLECNDLPSKVAEDTKGSADAIVHHQSGGLGCDPTPTATILPQDVEVVEEGNKLNSDHIQSSEIAINLSAVKQALVYEGSSEDFHRSSSIDSSDESVEIIDDVGMRFNALTLVPDFQ